MRRLYIVRSLISKLALFIPLAFSNFHLSFASENVALLPPVRRIGVDLPHTNLNEFRQFMEQDSRTLAGVPAQPFSENEFEKEFSLVVDNVLRDTGRFWILTNDATTEALQGNQSLAIKEKLTKTYDLDAWVRTDVSFRPDNTRIRLMLQNTSGDRIFIREDVLTDAQASLPEMKKALQSAAARFLTTLAHDARVTYLRDDLVTIDAGLERGIVNGTQLGAGYVTLSALHPQTGEYLRAKRIKTHYLEVIDSRKGSALCKITAVNTVAWNEFKQRLVTKNPPLLVWLRDSEKNSETAWSDPQDSHKEPIVGTTGSGFATATPRSQYIPPPTPVGEGYGPGYPYNNVDQSTTESAVQNNAPFQGQSESQPFPQSNSSQASPNESYLSYGSGPIWDDPQSWKLMRVRAGAGIDFGLLKGLDIEKGASTTRNTGIFPMATGNVLYDLGQQISLDAGATLSLYQGGAVEGQTYRLFGVAQMPILSQGNNRFEVGAGLAINGGSLTAKLLKVDKMSPLALERFDIVVRGDYQTRFDGLGKVRGVADLNLLKLFSLEGKYQFEVSDSPLFPKPLTAFAYFLNYPTPSAKNKALWWVEVGAGAMWNFY